MCVCLRACVHACVRAHLCDCVPAQTMDHIVLATQEELAMCPGIGPQKVGKPSQSEGKGQQLKLKCYD